MLLKGSTLFCYRCWSLFMIKTISSSCDRTFVTSLVAYVTLHGHFFFPQRINTNGEHWNWHIIHNTILRIRSIFMPVRQSHGVIFHDSVDRTLLSELWPSQGMTLPRTLTKRPSNAPRLPDSSRALYRPIFIIKHAHAIATGKKGDGKAGWTKEEKGRRRWGEHRNTEKNEGLPKC